MVTTRGGSGRNQPRKRGKPVARVKFGSAVIPVYRSDSEGRTRFTISFYRDGRRLRRVFRDLDRAKREALLVAQQIQSGREDATDVRPHEREAYLAAIRVLKDVDVPLVAAVQEYVMARKKLVDVPLGTAVDDYIKRCQGIRPGVEVAEVVNELLRAKREDGVSQRYFLQLQSNLTRLSADFPVPIMEVKRGEIDDWLRRRKVTARSRNNLLATIKVLFSFAKKRGYLPANERTEAELLTKVKAPDVETEVFTPEQFQRILHAAPPRLIPVLAIGGFAGVRQAELDRLDWNAVDLERRIIEVRAGQAKTASRRLIPVPDNLRKWLEPLPREGPVVSDADLHRQVPSLARNLGIGWPRNVLRHSFISYRIAEVQSADQVALEAGNSPAIIFKHYRELATREQAREWFSIVPKSGQFEANDVQWDRRRRRIQLGTNGHDAD